MGNHKIGEIVRLKESSHDYTGKYAGTKVEIVQLKENYCTVRAYDDKEFMCPYAYFDFDGPALPVPKCTCGAHKTWGKDCPPYFHYDFCPLYRPKPKEEE